MKKHFLARQITENQRPVSRLSRNKRGNKRDPFVALRLLAGGREERIGGSLKELRPDPEKTRIRPHLHPAFSAGEKSSILAANKEHRYHAERESEEETSGKNGQGMKAHIFF